MILRRLAAVAAALALYAGGAAGAMAQEPSELWDTFPLDPTPAPAENGGGAQPTTRTAAAKPAGDGGSSTPWIVAAVLGTAGIAMTIAGLSAARRAAREPEPDTTPAMPARRAPAPRADERKDEVAAARAERRSPPRPHEGVSARREEAAAARREEAAAARREDAAAARREDAAAARRQERAVARAAPEQPAPLPVAQAGAAPPRRPAPVSVELTEHADWEECRVALSENEGDDHHFIAVGAGEPVARSPVFHVRRASAVMESTPGRDALQTLVTYLLEGGWQLVGRDEEAWALRFRRRVRAPTAMQGQPARR